MKKADDFNSDSAVIFLQLGIAHFGRKPDKHSAIFLLFCLKFATELEFQYHSNGFSMST